MKIIERIQTALLEGNTGEVKEGVSLALAEGMAPDVIVNDALIASLEIIGARFKKNEVYVPEVLIAARAMKAGMDVLKPLMSGDALTKKGTMVIGTVKGDLHDIGKNLVRMMVEGAGFEVIDLGIDIPVERFVAAVEENKPHIVGISALLTTTMVHMKETVDGLAPYRDQVKIIVGGAPVTQEFAGNIGADGYAVDAAAAVDLVKKLLKQA